MPVFTLKVTLRHVHPPVWRRVRVPSSITLAQLHDILQIALGWSNSHMHQFRVGHEYYGRADLEDPDTKNESKAKLERVAHDGARFVYAYDMGDDWEHDVLVEKIDSAVHDELACLEGRRSVPPEDSGGPPGYENLIVALADPKHPEHDDLTEWVGPSWKAEHFDLDLVNSELRKLAARWRKRAAPKQARPRAAKRADS